MKFCLQNIFLKVTVTDIVKRVAITINKPSSINGKIKGEKGRTIASEDKK